MVKNTYYDVKNMVSFIKEHNSFALFCHTSPDEDALGSLLSMQYILKTLDKQVKIYCDGDVPDNLNYLRIHLDDDIDYISQCEVAMMLDANVPSRLGKYGSYYENAKIKAKIDHHILSDYSFDCEVAYTKAPSTCDIIFDIARSFDINLDDKLATYLYLGISSDTGSFIHPCTNEQSHYNAYELYSTSFDSEKANYYLFKYKRADYLSFVKMILKNTKRYFNGELNISFISRKNYNRYKMTYDMCSFSFLDGIDGNKISARISEKEKGCFHVSLRSQGKYNVCNVAKKFNGGGHVNASGYVLECSKKQLLSSLIEACKDELNR